MGKKIYEWDTAPGDNDFTAANGGWPEGMLRSDVNNAARENLADLREWHDDMEWQVVRIQGPEANDVGIFTRTGNNTFTIQMPSNEDLRPHFPDGRLLRFENGGSQVGEVTQVVGSSFLTDTTTITTTDVTSKHIDGSATDVKAYFSKSAGNLVLDNRSSDFYVPATNDSEGIQSAVADAMAAGGGTILLTASSYNIDAQIDLTSVTSYLTFKGATPEVTLLQPSSTNLASMVAFSDGAQLVTFEDIRFNYNIAGNGSGAGTCLDVLNNISLTVKGCQFTQCVTGINFSGTTGTRIIIENSKFFNCSQSGIMTPQTGDHRGTISDCVFDGASMDSSSSGMVKVAGKWNIDNNRFLNCGHASISTRAIWLWNESIAEPGGRQCSVTNNGINCDNDVNGTAIEMGGDDIAVTGNRVVLGTSGVGFYVNASGSGTTNRRLSITGNTVQGGNSCMTVTDRVRDLVASSNTFDPDTTGCIIQGDDILVTSNHISGGTRAVAVNTGANRCTISNNQMRDQSGSGVLLDTVTNIVVVGNVMDVPSAVGVNTANTCTDIRINDNRIDAATTGISLGASVSGAVVTNNDTIGCTADISDSGTSTNRMWNSFDVHRETIRDTQSGTGNGNDTAHPLPCGGKAGRYVSTICLQGIASSGSFSGTLTGYYGPNGTNVDTALPIAATTQPTNALAAGSTVQFEFTAANTDTLFGLYWVLNGGNTDFDFSITIEKVGLE